MIMGMRCKITMNLKLGLCLMLLLSVSVKIKADKSYAQCEHAVKKWASSRSANSEVRYDKYTLRDLLFFLHVPRTGGRTYFHCFLKKLYTISEECPRSYDKLRYNPRNSNCRLLSTHDDYSVMSKLPKERTSVITILRDPIDRVFSTYEFSVEVAARFLFHSNSTSVKKQPERSKKTGVNTLDIWPWKYLVPWMREDLFARRDARKLRGHVPLVANNPYDAEDIVMPLHNYINDPIAQDIVHNGATFQIVGLTNNSYYAKAHEVRHCVLKYRSLGEYVLEVAKKKLDNMLYVGLTQNHKESANMFASIVGAQVISRRKASSSTSDEQNSKTKPDANDKGNNTYWSQKYALSIRDESFQKNLTVEKMMEIYESCITSLRDSQAERRLASLKGIFPANFTKEARRKVPESLIQEIASLNSLDVELYKYGQEIFKKQQAIMQNMVKTERTVDTYTLSTGTNLPTFYLVSITALVLLLVVFSYVNSKRTSSKVKL